MTMTPTFPPSEPAPSPEELARDHHFELLLDEVVGSTEDVSFPPDFTIRVLASRPFAPWEVRTFRVWRVPAAAGAVLVVGSLGLGLAPLWSLGPFTAFSLWGHLLAVAVSEPASAALAAGPLLAEVLSKVSSRLPASTLWVAAGVTALAAGQLAFALRSRERTGGARDAARS